MKPPGTGNGDYSSGGGVGSYAISTMTDLGAVNVGPGQVVIALN